jgi:hypothetical protein
MRIHQIPVFSLLITGRLTGLQASGQSEAAKYTVVQPGQPLARDSFAVFCATNIPAREDVRKPEFGAEWSYSGRDWQSCPDTRKKKRRFPIDPNRFQYIVWLIARCRLCSR